MKSIIDAIKKNLKSEGIGEKTVTLLKDLREWFKNNLKEPGYVRMIRLAYENIEENNDYTFLYLEEEDGKANLEYLIDLLSDHSNKYNKDELIDIRHLMEGTSREEEEEEGEGQESAE
jgi:hypothetical protein